MERYRNYIRPYRAAFIAGPILMLTEVVGEIALPKMMSLIINNGVANHDVGYILRIGAAMIGFAIDVYKRQLPEQFFCYCSQLSV